MVVDDDEQYLEMTSRVLRRAGYEVVTRCDVIGTSSAVAAEQPDVMLCDLNMPLIDGDRLVPLIQRAPNPPYIVMYSGLDAQTLEDRAHRCGADASIHKGIGAKQFLERMAHCVACASAARALRAGLAR